MIFLFLFIKNHRNASCLPVISVHSDGSGYLSAAPHAEGLSAEPQAAGLSEEPQAAGLSEEPQAVPVAFHSFKFESAINSTS